MHALWQDLRTELHREHAAEVRSLQEQHELQCAVLDDLVNSVKANCEQRVQGENRKWILTSCRSPLHNAEAPSSHSQYVLPPICCMLIYTAMHQCRFSMQSDADVMFVAECEAQLKTAQAEVKSLQSDLKQLESQEDANLRSSTSSSIRVSRHAFLC